MARCPVPGHESEREGVCLCGGEQIKEEPARALAAAHGPGTWATTGTAGSYVLSHRGHPRLPFPPSQPCHPPRCSSRTSVASLTSTPWSTDGQDLIHSLSPQTALGGPAWALSCPGHVLVRPAVSLLKPTLSPHRRLLPGQWPLARSHLCDGDWAVGSPRDSLQQTCSWSSDLKNPGPPSPRRINSNPRTAFVTLPAWPGRPCPV